MNFSGSISMKRSYERSLSAGLIHMSPMHLGYEDLLMQQDNFQGLKNCELIQKGGKLNAEGRSTTASTQTLNRTIACKCKEASNWRERANLYPNF